MKSLATLLLTSTLALAGPLGTRQASPAEIISSSVSGNGCPQGTFTSSISIDGQTLTYGFDDYSVSVGQGAPPDSREKTCDVTIRIRFPQGCTNARISSTYHGFAQLEQGVTGTFASQYNLSPGQILSGGNPPPATVSSAGFGGAGNVYTKADSAAARVNVVNQSQNVVTYIARTRVFTQSANGVAFGSLSVDDATINISQQSRCW